MFAYPSHSFPPRIQPSLASRDAERMVAPSGYDRDFLEGGVELALDASRAPQEPPQTFQNGIDPTTRFVAPVWNWLDMEPYYGGPDPTVPMPRSQPTFHPSLSTLTVPPASFAMPNNFPIQNFFTPTLTVSPTDLLLYNSANQDISWHFPPTLATSPTQLFSLSSTHVHNPPFAPVAPTNFLPASNYQTDPFPAYTPFPTTSAYPPLPPPGHSTSHDEQPPPTLFSIGSPASSESSSGSDSSIAESSTSSSSSSSRRYKPQFYPANRFNEEGQKSGVHCAQIFECKWGSCGAQIELEGYSAAQHIEFNNAVQKHIEEHAEPCGVNGERVCYWEGLDGVCTKPGRFTKLRAMERHIKTHLEHWRVFCQGCESTFSRASQLPEHHEMCKKYRAKQAAGKLTTPTTKKRKAAARKRKV